MKIAVVGGYQTKFGELWNYSLEDLIREAVEGVLKDGNVSKESIQSVFVGNMLAGTVQEQHHLPSLVQEIIGISVPTTRVEAACASGGVAVRQAVLALLSGEYETALVLGVEKMTDVDSETIANALMSAAGEQERMAGLTFPGLYAMLAQTYLDTFNYTSSELSSVPVKNHFHASLHKKAHFSHPITEEDVVRSAAVANPLRILDCSPISDGAAALFLATPQWVKRHQARNGVYIVGSSQANDVLSLSNRESLLELKASRLASTKAYEQAGVESQDLHCAEVHDCFSIAEVLALEDVGIFAKGEAINHSQLKHTQLGGKIPVNTSGGLKACGHPVGATGVKQLVELTHQLRTEAKGRQVEGAKLGLAQNVGGTGGTVVVHILQK